MSLEVDLEYLSALSGSLRGTTDRISETSVDQPVSGIDNALPGCTTAATSEARGLLAKEAINTVAQRISDICTRIDLSAEIYARTEDDTRADLSDAGKPIW